MKKKIAIAVSSSIVAIILIVAITMTSIVFAKDLDNNIDFLDKVYNEDVDTSKVVDINVASYNTRSWSSNKDNLTKIREQIESYDVDIVGLQEIDTDNSLRSSSAKCTSTLASGKYTSHIFAPTRSLYLGDNYGIMTMSQNSIQESNIMYLPMPHRWFMYIGEPRVVVRTVVNVDGIDIAFYNTHLSFENGIKMKGGEEMRAAQIKFIYDVMDKDPCEYKVLVGDLNLLNFEELDIFTKSGKYGMMNNSEHQYDSYPGDDVTFHALDNIIFTNNMTLVEASMVENTLSDHNMLFAKLRIS